MFRGFKLDKDCEKAPFIKGYDFSFCIKQYEREEITHQNIMCREEASLIFSDIFRQCWGDTQII